jgi:hypothetical protein
MGLRRISPIRLATIARYGGRESVYQRLGDEVQLPQAAGFAVDATCRRGSFAVLVGRKPTRRRASKGGSVTRARAMKPRQRRAQPSSTFATICWAEAPLAACFRSNSCCVR